MGGLIQTSAINLTPCGATGCVKEAVSRPLGLWFGQSKTTFVVALNPFPTTTYNYYTLNPSPTTSYDNTH
jgi:hypothetical protein